ncbi:MAG: metallophosphoesterase [Chryseolinea sp.]
MRSIIRYLLLKPILWLVARFDSAPDRQRVFEALTKLKDTIINKPGKKGFIIPFDHLESKIIVFSDQHKGAKNGADDFMRAESNYLAALEFYETEKYHFVSLGDGEELWENTLNQVKKNNLPSFDAESKFLRRHAFTKVFGNHDLDWDINPLAEQELKNIYGSTIIALEGIVLQGKIGNKKIRIFCTHGHQGDARSDGNYFSKWFVSVIWAPLQAYLRINPNTPAYNATLKTVHNQMMYEWSSQQNDILLITGHTHQPVFESLTHYERIQRSDDSKSKQFESVKPMYFNSGCCCFDDGDITGIELSGGEIRLIKWTRKEGLPIRVVLESETLAKLFNK